MIRSGTVRFWDMYWHQLDVARAVLDSGMRATIGQPILEFDGAPDGARPEAAAEGIAALARARAPGRRLRSPRTRTTRVSEPSLRLIAEISAEHDVPVHTHLSETEQEVHDCIDAHGCRPAYYLDRLGLLNERSVLAHGVWLDDDELALIAERGATIVTNPVSNMKLAVGRAFPYPQARGGRRRGRARHRRRRRRTTRSTSSRDIKVLALLQKHTTRRPVDRFPRREAWAIATGALAPRLGGTPIAVGAARRLPAGRHARAPR